MSENAQKAYESMESLVELDPVAGDWFELTQERINDFADTTLDHPIHSHRSRTCSTNTIWRNSCTWLLNSFYACPFIYNHSSSSPRLEGILMRSTMD